MSNYRRGDPDPTPDFLEEDIEACAAITRTADYLSGVYCTWPEGHEGDHVAGDGSVVMATWPSKDSISQADIDAAIESIQKEMRK